MIFKKMKKLTKGQSGSSIVLAGVSLVALLSMAGLVIDGGTLFVTKTSMQKAANAAVLSGGQELLSSEDDVRRIVHEVLQAHSEDGSLQEEDLNIQMNDKVSVDLKKEVPLSFSKLLGFETAPVQVHAAAKIGTMVKAEGAAPLGIEKSVLLNLIQLNTEYQLKVDQTNVDTGNFGVLALGGTGADTYEYNLEHGYDDALSLGDVLDTQTGNIAGKTRTVVKEKWDRCPIGEENERDCERVILIPVYEEVPHDGQQLKQVKIVGFAYFLITKEMGGNDKAITGKFIKRIDTGTVGGSTETNYGAFGIRLVE